MDSIQILEAAKYMPKKKRENQELNKKFNLDENWIEKRTGIKNRYIAQEEITSLATRVAKQIIKKSKIEKMDLIIVATTSTDRLMPSIAFEVQKALEIEKCICFDILAGCSGYINAIDLARKYIALGEVENALVIGVEKLSDYLEEKDINLVTLLGDGAGAVLLGKSKEKKLYEVKIEANMDRENILTCCSNQKLQMDGKKVYKYGITKTVEIVNELLEKANEKVENMKYIIPHQSNIRMIQKIAEGLQISMDKIYTNLKDNGNTFCASIPIAIADLMEKKLLYKGDKVILLRVWRRIKYRKYFT